MLTVNRSLTLELSVTALLAASSCTAFHKTPLLRPAVRSCCRCNFKNSKNDQPVLCAFKREITSDSTTREFSATATNDFLQAIWESRSPSTIISTPESLVVKQKNRANNNAAHRQNRDTALDHIKLPLQHMGKADAGVKTTDESTSNTKALDLDWSKLLLPALATLVLGGGTAVLSSLGISASDVVSGVEQVIADPSSVLQSAVDGVQVMGPLGMLYFSLFYLVAELLAVPATPLTLAAGSLFGFSQGVITVLIPATIAASIAFVVGKTFLRSWVEEILAENPKFEKLDRAVGKQGFKLLVLVRLSPIFPFSLSNYVYGASSISFPSYFWGTLLGFLPGTAAYVYTGMVGKELVLGGDNSQPWYVYAAGLAILAGLLKLVTDVASEIVDAIDDEPTA